MDGCLFCAIASGAIPCHKIYEDDTVCSFLDINPFSEGHALVVPKRHFAGLLDTPEEELAAIVARVKRIAAHIKEALPCDGFNILQNNGAAAGQTVMHLHFHIVPRKEGGATAFTPRAADPEALKALAERLRFA